MPGRCPAGDRIVCGLRLGSVISPLVHRDYGGPMRTGRCLCGEVTFELSGDVIATAVCHCDRCQRQSGGAFSVNLVAHESQLTVHGELKTYEERGERNDDVYVRRRFCGSCGSPMWPTSVPRRATICTAAGSPPRSICF
mgnify:CR=1 FL=1